MVSCRPITSTQRFCCTRVGTITNSTASFSTLTSTDAGSATGAPTNRDLLLQRYERWLVDQHIDLSKIDVTKMKPSTGRGLYSKKRIMAGERIVSIPMHNIIMNAKTLASYSQVVKKYEPPQLDAVKRVMMSRGIRDPALYHMMHLSLLVACERSDTDSFFTPYFDVLPHPAIPDKDVIALHKSSIDAPCILEWGEHRQEFAVVCRKLMDVWDAEGSGQYPVHPLIIDWAWRTILSRQHMLPDTCVKSSLNYNAFSTFYDIDSMGWSPIIRKMLRKVFPERILKAGESFLGKDYGDEYRLVPTLVPVIDQIGHLSAGNASVEVVTRDVTYAELHATCDIQPGEEVGMSLSRSHTAAFTLYRFGFLPL
eukprot:Tbor_TRINITY_DN5198_c6_g4::TRINITY_DN5198_c6_g4_i1::g.25671::m.25671